jgi:two-component system C4-dicarboxylate transport sensor histidine kinase DctB
MVLHNLFFLVLTTAAYFSLIPLYEQLATDTRAHQVVVSGRIPSAAAQANLRSQQSALNQARVRLFLVLGIIYLLAVVVLESAIMPWYVYRPLRRMLAADAATQAGDREGELIPEPEIMGDEIGQIMRSRNDTVEALRKREDELAAALRRIEEQDRLVSLGLLSASVAHELNTPLAVLAGSIEKLIETNPDSHTQERLARMQRVTHRLRRISESLVDFSRVRKTQMEPTALRPLIEEAWTLVAIDEKSSHVEFLNYAATEHRVIGNPDRLLQVFVNLLRNALNAIGSDSTGRIEVRTRREQRDGRASIVLTVEDNGQGIPAYVLPDIFDAFVTTRLDAHGTGLGLTVAEGIITQHGGTIAASNRPQGGACLEVCLPAA